MGTVAGRRVRRRGEAGYAMLDSLIALALITVSLSGIGVLLRGALDCETVLVERTAALIIARNTIAVGVDAKDRH